MEITLQDIYSYAEAMNGHPECLRLLMSSNTQHIDVDVQDTNGQWVCMLVQRHDALGWSFSCYISFKAILICFATIINHFPPSRQDSTDVGCSEWTHGVCVLPAESRSQRRKTGPLGTVRTAPRGGIVSHYYSYLYIWWRVTMLGTFKCTRRPSQARRSVWRLFYKGGLVFM